MAAVHLHNVCFHRAFGPGFSARSSSNRAYLRTSRPGDDCTAPWLHNRIKLRLKARTASTQQVDAAGPSAAAPSAAASSPEHTAGTFNWLQAWYPCAVISQLKPNAPNAFSLLGRPLVLWRDGTGTWRAHEDRCPHRLAPLSEGRIDPATGHLSCSYHGWQFSGCGSCCRIPQIGDAGAAAGATASRRSRLATYPTQVHQGILWVWGDASEGAAAAAAGVRPAVCDELEEEASGFSLLGLDWFQRDLEYGFDTLMENLFDPSHIPFAHHGIMGSASRDKATPLSFKTLAEASPCGGFQLFRDTAPFNIGRPTDTVNNFIPPASNHTSQTSGGSTLILQFYGVPTTPGRCRLISGFLTNRKLPGVMKPLLPLVEWYFHLGQHIVLDSDAMILHLQERALAGPPGGADSWRTSFYLPAGADAGVIQFRRWFHDCAGGAVPWPHGLPRLLGPALPRRVVMDRWGQHTASCRHCQRAAAVVSRLKAGALLAAAVLGALVLQALLPGAPQPPGWQTVAAAAAVAGMLLLHRQLDRLLSKFTFTDYIHAFA